MVSVAGVAEAFCTARLAEERVGAELLERECVALFHKLVSMVPGSQRDAR